MIPNVNRCEFNGVVRQGAQLYLVPRRSARLALFTETELLLILLRQKQSLVAGSQLTAERKVVAPEDDALPRYHRH
jgi:hypothetical protein